MRQHHALKGHVFEQTLGDGEGQGSLVCCNSWGSKIGGHDLAAEQQQQTQGVIFKLKC